MTQAALITGGAGFIGSHVVDSLLRDGWRVTAIDNFDQFYSPALKRRNVLPHLDYDEYALCEVDIRDAESLERRIHGDFQVIVHLAGRAGVRPSIDEPVNYLTTNVLGTQNLLDFSRRRRIPKFIFASSSSVYGKNPDVPWKESASAMPVSAYAATKLSAEALGHTYSHVHKLPFTALRFFTVYGPRQRPDLAIRTFATRIMNDEPISVLGDGSAQRDFTYIDDVVQGVRRAIAHEGALFETINIGNSATISVRDMIRELESALGRRARILWQDSFAGDVHSTWADISKAKRLLGYEPQTSFTSGLQRFVSWLLTQSGMWVAPRLTQRKAVFRELPTSRAAS